LKYFADYAWDTSDTAQKEVTRYQSDPGQATAYMIGQLQIMKLRDYAKQKLGAKFNLKDFHFYLLSQGVVTLQNLKENIESYVNCTLSDGKGEGCNNVLNPLPKNDGNGKKAASVKTEGVVDDILWQHNQPKRPTIDSYM